MNGCQAATPPADPRRFRHPPLSAGDPGGGLLRGISKARRHQIGIYVRGSKAKKLLDGGGAAAAERRERRDKVGWVEGQTVRMGGRENREIGRSGDREGGRAGGRLS